MDSQNSDVSSIFSQETNEVLQDFLMKNELLDINFEEEKEISAEALPPPTGRLPVTEELPGSFDFNYLITHLGPNCSYSQELNQAFVAPNLDIFIQFQLRNTLLEIPKGLRIRVLPVYLLDDYITEPVLRCPSHILDDDPLRQAHSPPGDDCNCHSYNLAGHIVKTNFQGSEYHYDKISGRHSVSIPIDGPSMLVPFQFCCKTSCSRGMQRRVIRLIFTLEDILSGNVLGRRLLPVKICKCPRRDMLRLEAGTERRKSCDDKGPASKKRLLYTPTELIFISLTSKHHKPNLCKEEKRGTIISNHSNIKKFLNDLIEFLRK